MKNKRNEGAPRKERYFYNEVVENRYGNNL